MKTVIKKLKRKKSCGPDNFPNEIFIEANATTIETFRKLFNNILKTNNIPPNGKKETSQESTKAKVQRASVQMKEE